MLGRGKHDASKLLEAAWSGDESKVKEVLTRNIDLLNTGASRGISRHQSNFEEGVTALHLAARRGHQRIVEFLLSLHAVVGAKSSSGVTPLHYAVSEDHEDIARLLLDHDAEADVRNSNGRTPLHSAALSGHHDVAQLLLARGARANTQDGESNTPLHEAAKVCSQPVARLLTKAGANVNERNAQGRAPLHVAIVNADHSAAGQINPRLHTQREAATHFVKSLLDWGADVNAVDEVGETALDLMTYLEGESGSELVDLLRRHGGEWVRYRHRHQEGTTTSASSDETLVGAAPSPEAAAQETNAGDHGGAPIKLGAQPILIGRSTECDVRYESRTLSRRHARIEQTADGYVITDLDSHNGTLIDDVPISEPHVLVAGQTITLGAYEFQFDGTQLMPIHDELSQEQLSEERQFR